MHAALKAAFQLQSPIDWFLARSCAAGSQIGRIAAYDLQDMPALLQSPGEVRHATAIAA